MNIEKITEVVPVFGTTGPNARKTRKTNLENLQNSGVNFNTYTIHEGETLRFPKYEDMECIDIEVTPGSNTYTTIVKCESEDKDGHKKATYFSLASLRKRDAENTPVQPTWYDLGNDGARLRALAKVGEIHGERTVEIMAPKFINGKRAEVEVLNEDGSPVIENGKVKIAYDDRPQKVVIISEYDAEA